MTKYLPFELPQISSYGHNAIALGILSCHPTEQTKLWFTQSYIQLVASRDTQKIMFESEFNDNSYLWCPFLLRYIIPLDLLDDSGKDIIDLLRQMIAEEIYVNIRCDRFYFPFCKARYHQEHFLHYALVVGFDDVSQSVTLVDYFNRKYSLHTASFDDLRRAFYSEDCRTRKPFGEILTGVKYRESLEFPITYNPHRLVYLAEEYLRGNVDTRNDVWRGISVYDALKQFINYDIYYLSTIQIIYDHKVAMLQRIKMLDEMGYVHITANDIRLFEDAVHEAIILRNLLLKQEANFLNSRKTQQNQKTRILGKIDEFKKIDENVMKQFIHIVKHSGNNERSTTNSQEQN